MRKTKWTPVRLGRFVEILVSKPIPALPVRHEFSRNEAGELVWTTFEREVKYVGSKEALSILRMDGRI